MFILFLILFFVLFFVTVTWSETWYSWIFQTGESFYYWYVFAKNWGNILSNFKNFAKSYSVIRCHICCNHSWMSPFTALALLQGFRIFSKNVWINVTWWRHLSSCLGVVWAKGHDQARCSQFKFHFVWTTRQIFVGEISWWLCQPEGADSGIQLSRYSINSFSEVHK